MDDIQAWSDNADSTEEESTRVSVVDISGDVHVLPEGLKQKFHEDWLTVATIVHIYPGIIDIHFKTAESLREREKLERDLKIVFRYLSIGDFEDEIAITMREIAVLYDLSPQVVQQAYSRTCRKLRSKYYLIGRFD